MTEFDRLLEQILQGEYLSTYIAHLNDGTFKIRFKCGDNSFITKRSFPTLKEADEWAWNRLNKLSDMLSELGYTRRTDAHPN